MLQSKYTIAHASQGFCQALAFGGATCQLLTQQITVHLMQHLKLHPPSFSPTTKAVSVSPRRQPTSPMVLVQTLRYGGVTQPRVLLVDTDGQAHATLLTTGRNDFGEKDSLHAVLMAQREDIVPTLQQCLVSSHWDEGLHVLPGSAWLDETENLLFSANGAPYRLAQALAPIAHSYNAIVIDTRPSYTLMTKMAILAGTDAIIPIEPRYLESIALNEAIREIIDIRDGWGYNHINISGILLDQSGQAHQGTQECGQRPQG
jgi:cellulose biosynthesis protein BcsQ